MEVQRSIHVHRVLLLGDLQRSGCLLGCLPLLLGTTSRVVVLRLLGLTALAQNMLLVVLLLATTVKLLLLLHDQLVQAFVVHHGLLRLLAGPIMRNLLSLKDLAAGEAALRGVLLGQSLVKGHVVLVQG